jgi:sugar phosphate isomerase/epimerase
MSTFKRAFSKPTPADGDFELLMTTFRDEGYEGLQLKTGQFFPYLDDVDGYLHRWGDDPGRTSALVFFDTLDGDAQIRLTKSIELAARTGGERVVFCHNHDRTDTGRAEREAYARTLSHYGAQSRERGIALSLHHHYNQPVMVHDDFVEFFGATEPGTVGLTVDTAHLAKSGFTDLPGFIREFREVIDNIHLKDYRDGEWRLLGEGDLDLEGILETLEEIGYDGWLCVDEESAADLLTGFRTSKRWLDVNQTATSAPAQPAR